MFVEKHIEIGVDVTVVFRMESGEGWFRYTVPKRDAHKYPLNTNFEIEITRTILNPDEGGA